MKPLVRAAVSLGLLVVIALIVPWHELAQAAGRVRPLVWLGALGGFLAGHLLGVEKWRTVIHASGGMLAARDAVRCYAAGLFANLCLPTVVGGDVLRAALAGARSPRPQAAVWGSVVDRLNDLLATALLIGAGLLLSHAALPAAWANVLLVGGAVLGVLAIAMVASLLRPRALARWPRRLRHMVMRTMIALQRSRRAPGRWALALAASLVMQAFFVWLNAWLGASIGIHLPHGAWLVAWPLAKIAGLAPISLGGLAVREAALAGLLLPFGVPLSQGIVVALLWQSVLIAGGLVAGAVWWVLGRASGVAATLHPVLPGSRPR